MEKKIIEEITGKKQKEKKVDSSKNLPKRPARKMNTVKFDNRNTNRKGSWKLDVNQNEKNKPNEDIPLRRRSLQGPDNLTQQVVLKKKFKCIKTYTNAHQDFIEKLVVLKNGKIASCSYDNLIKLWDISEISKKPTQIFKGHTNTVTDLIQYTNVLLASVSKDKTIRKWNVNNGKEVYCYEVVSPFLCICPVTDTTVCCGGGDKTLRVYDLSIDKEIEELYQLNGHSDIILCLLQVNSSMFASGSSDKSIRFWEIETRKHLFTLEGHTQDISCMKVLKDKRFASGSYDNTIIIWNIEKRDAEMKFEGHTGHVLCIAQLFDGRIISGASDWSMIIWNMQNGTADTTLEAHKEAVSSIVVSREGLIVSASRDQCIKVWE